jgi:hypothetical protein
MIYQLAADMVLIVHALFLVLVVIGGLLIFHRAYWALIQLPAAGWGVWAELTGRVCPLTLLENHLLRQAGETGYSESFVGHYLLAMIYPDGLTRELQIWLGLCVLLINGVVYGSFFYRLGSRRRTP